MSTQLAEENSRLRQRIEDLEVLLGLDEKPRVRLGRNSERVSIVLLLLLKRDLVSRLAILLAIGRDGNTTPNIADVYVSQARKVLAEWCIPLRTDWGRGWYIERKYKEALRSRLMVEEARAA